MIANELSRGTAIIFECYALAQIRADGNDKENENDTDCFCDGGRSVPAGSRWRDFASCANRAASERRHWR